jgi:hypothetical protein
MGTPELFELTLPQGKDAGLNQWRFVMGMDRDYTQDLINTRNEEYARRYRRSNEPITYDEIQEHQHQERLRKVEDSTQKNNEEEYL